MKPIGVIAAVAVVGLAVAAAFGAFTKPQDTDAEEKPSVPVVDVNDPLAKAVGAKVTECKLSAETAGPCTKSATPDVRCSCECLITATCEQISSGKQDSPFFQCLAKCSPGQNH
jgi:hypothetical protein